ncbi:tRNA pseudouridine(55) synthase TruB [Haloflavibacter putidus]|uniref:tRNA pseudouridine synthase B n=1 Tax=Haloflavibacter putidus TaxID=2576776 RepID=A0A507ZQJ9_9FLAO|nr:tRNA pseudouridine(55) synthase TruB [Haloflavibacter putidus]TQD38554.1 tRNA pseudouridine(55) synthase TruB [Haloflavibacter putidus]
MFLKHFTLEDFKNGQLLLLDKPLEWTSFQLVNKVRWLIKKSYGIKKIKVGHAGTLDPLATGLLLICTGKFTKRIQELQGLEKEYTGTFTLGATTPSYDLETEIDQTFETKHLTKEQLNNATKQFTGKIEQYPPVFSALKKEGKRLYEYARKGEEVKIDPREVSISSFTLTRIALPEVDFKVTCSKGTYIRSLAHDFGKAVNSGAHLSSLRRTKIGDFTIENAMSLEEFIYKLPPKPQQE